jgi:hypothetical protein
VRDGKADEAVIVGHGFGAVLAINVIGRALTRDAALGRLTANERPGGSYDYYLSCCGPCDLMTWATKPQDAFVAIAAKSGQP